MTALGQSRSFDDIHAMSGLPLQADLCASSPFVSEVPIPGSCTEAMALLSFCLAKGQSVRLRASANRLVQKTKHMRDDLLCFEPIITGRAAPGDVLVWSHQHEPSSVNRDEIRLIEP
jgi:hypothetical protein